MCATIVEQACVYCTSNNRKCAKGSQEIVQQACVYCTSNNRKCAKRAQQSWNRLVCIVRVITVSVRSVLNNPTTGLCVLYE